MTLVSFLQKQFDQKKAMKPMNLQPGTILQQRYQITQTIAQGGMGVVYKATDLRLKNSVALKQTRFQETRLLEAFEREAMVLACLRHPAFPRVIDHFTEPEGQFLVMDFIPGPDLGQVLEKRGTPFPLDDVLQWADTLLDALEYLHRQQPPIIHRDIKPQNIKVMRDGQVILLDFGLAKGISADQTRRIDQSIVGHTPGYAPLEQIQCLGTTPRSDVYSLGASLYHLLTSTPPPDALTRAAALFVGSPDPLEPPTHLPDAINRIIMQAMAIKEEDRPASATALRHALAQVAHSITEQPRSSSSIPDSSGQPTIVLPASSAQEVQTVFIPELAHKPQTIWNALEIESDVVTAMDFSPDGTMLAVAVLGKTVHVYDVSTGQQTQKLKGHKGWWIFGSVHSIAFSPNGKILATGGADKTIRLWDVAQGNQIALLKGHTDEVTSLAFSPDGTTLISGSWDKTVRLWDVQQEHDTAIRMPGHTNTIRSVAISPDGHLIVSAGDDTTIRIWDRHTHRQIRNLNKQTRAILSVVVSPLGHLFAAAGKDTTISLWSISEGYTLIRSITAHTKTINCLAFHPGGQILVSGSTDRTFAVWDVPTGNLLHRLKPGPGGINSVIFSPDGQMLAVGAYNVHLYGLV